MCPLRLQVLSSACHAHEGPFIPTSALSGMWAPLRDSMALRAGEAAQAHVCQPFSVCKLTSYKAEGSPGAGLPLVHVS